MSDSEESDDIGYLVESGPGGESGSEDESGSSEESDEGSQASQSESESNPLFDLEAADSDDESDSNENGEAGGFGSWSEDHFFPQFNRLPIELRHHIWEFFCPDLSVKGRVYCFILQQWFRKKDVSRGLTISEGAFLEQQTRPTRAMSAVHHESRQIALKASPDTLVFYDHSVIRFNAERDMVLLDSTQLAGDQIDMYEVPRFRGFSEHIRHLALEPAMFTREIEREWNSSTLFGIYPNLKTLHYVSSPTYHRPQNLRWCTSELAKLYSFTTFEDQPGLGEDSQQLYCWPDFENPRAFVEAEVSLRAVSKDCFGDHIDTQGPNLDGVTIWPMIEFGFDPKQPCFEDLLSWDGQADLGWDYHHDEDEEEEPNEYESEGIDDSDISSDDSLQSETGDLVVLGDDDDDSDQEEDRSAGGSSVLSGTSQHRSQDGAIDLTGDDPDVIAAFSSPEQSSATLQGSDESAHESDQPAPRKSRLKRPRARVVESDSEDDSADDIPRKRARTDNRQNPIVLSSDDEEDEGRKKRAKYQTRTVVSEDEDEENGRGTGNLDQGQDGGTDWSGISSSDDEDGESEEEEARPLSLAEKLQLHRHNNPIPSSDDDDSDIEAMGGDDYDARNYADFQDDEEGNEGSDDGDGDGQDDLSLGEYDDEDGGY
jgi:hypothetical protein